MIFSEERRSRIFQEINIVKKIYIITGANGFLGNNIIRKLEQDADNEIRAFVLKGDSIKSLEGLKCKIYYGDAETRFPYYNYRCDIVIPIFATAKLRRLLKIKL